MEDERILQHFTLKLTVSKFRAMIVLLVLFLSTVVNAQPHGICHTIGLKGQLVLVNRIDDSYHNNDMMNSKVLMTAPTLFSVEI
jgi:hypothetical protein